MISLMQWNTLAADLATTQSFPKVDPAILNFQFRLPLIFQYIDKINPDVLCLQQVDRPQLYRDHLAMSYKHIFFEKGKRTHGILIAVKDKIQISEFRPRIMANGKQFLQLRLTLEGSSAYLFVVHLTAKADRQAQRLAELKEISHCLSFVPADQPILVVGDFNSEPHYEGITTLIKEFTLSSAYDTKIKTTCKLREKQEFRTIDYILHRGLQINKVMELMNREEIGELGLPSKKFPSDHLFLQADINFKAK